jgi:hypothetical protein
MVNFILSLIIAQQITLPPEVKGKPGSFITIPATTDGSIVQWVVLDSGLELFPAELLASTRTAVVIAQSEGTYRLLAYTAKDNNPSQPTICRIIVKQSGPEPTPTPPEPEPEANSLQKQLQTLYGADNSQDKAKHKTALVGVYKELINATASPEISTYGQLYQVAQRASEKVIPKGALLPVRTEIARYLDDKLPNETKSELTLEERTRCAKEFSQVAKALEALK